ncbi:MAG TPA: RcnB family protein [Caulobacterales bacterium]|nr:RcnB family protein [Caulobacterales bacterium]
MRIRIILIALAAVIAAPASAQAFLYSPRHNHRGYYPPPPPNIATDKAYDHDYVYFRVHGKWPDGRTRAVWRRGEIMPLAIAQRAPAVDWRAARLYPPKSGYRWLDVGGDFLMVGDVSRLIAAIVLPTN